MIFTRKLNKYGDTKWKKKFALFPTEISCDDYKGVKTFVWLEFYEVKYIYADPDWLPTYTKRLIDKPRKGWV